MPSWPYEHHAVMVYFVCPICRVIEDATSVTSRVFHRHGAGSIELGRYLNREDAARAARGVERYDDVVFANGPVVERLVKGAAEKEPDDLTAAYMAGLERGKELGREGVGWVTAEKHGAQADAEREKNRADTLNLKVDRLQAALSAIKEVAKRAMEGNGGTTGQG